jgi:molecular chaperone GrpE (heat shock protein)
MRGQAVAARRELEVVREALRVAHSEADELREFQGALQHRSRSLAIAVMTFVEVLDQVAVVGRASADEAVQEQIDRLGDAVTRLLALFGLSEIATVGVPVDETQHEVVGRAPANDTASGVVMQVVQRGFAYHGNPVRRAQVVVAE